MNTRGMTGFTLVELLITLALGGILATMAVPAMRSFVQGQQQIAQINAWVGALGLARSEAILRGESIALCPSLDGATCAGQWANGWIVFVDRDRDIVVDAGEEILRVQPAISVGLTLGGTGNLANFVQFRPNGILSTQGVFMVCVGSNPQGAKAVELSFTGHTRNLTDNDNPLDGIPNDNSGNNITCTG